MKEWKNRHVNPLPNVDTPITIKLSKDPAIHGYGDIPLDGIWIPFDPNNYTKDTMPAEGYLGTFYDMILGHGFNAWKQNDSEFVDYVIRIVM